ncbi:MAG: hypothetical protein ACK5JT_00220 [Hyphomicrobiaceae bacterium]
MQYKGEDLDLRVSHPRSSRETYGVEYEGASYGNGRWQRGRPQGSAAGANDPVWVDEVILGCCNYAFDVAQANGAAEVDLEHLVNALTRVDGAARQLEARGVHEGQLRRESATLIASEMPASNAGEALSPRRSADFEEVLRSASELGSRRGGVAGVDEVLWVLLHYGRDLPVVVLLRRLTPDWQRADWGKGRVMQMPEPAPRPAQLVASDGFAGRMAGIEDHLRTLHQELVSERKLMVELVRDLQRDVMAQRGDNASLRSDIGQRLEDVERSLNARTEASRLPIQISDRLAQVEKTLSASTGTTSNAMVKISQRLDEMEGRLGGEGDRTATSALGERMTQLEKAVHSGLGEGARNWASLGQRLSSFEGSLKTVGTADAAGMATGLAQIRQRLSALEDGLGRKLGEQVSQRLGEVVDKRLDYRLGQLLESDRQVQQDFRQRLDGMGRMVEVIAAEGNKSRLAMAEHFDGIEARFVALPATTAAPQVLQQSEPVEVIERMSGLERAVRVGLGDAVTVTQTLAERVGAIERHIAEPRDENSAISELVQVDDRLGAIERFLEAQKNDSRSVREEVIARLRALEQRPAARADVDVSSLTGAVASQLTTLESSAASNVSTLKTELSEITTRIGQLDQLMKAEAASNEEALRGRDQDFDFIYNEIKKLGQSQTTLNSAVSDWRMESQEHFGALADRLDKLDEKSAQFVRENSVRVSSDMPSVLSGQRNGAKRDDMFEAGSPASAYQQNAGDQASMDSERQGTKEILLPEEPGRGFWFWLFGTHNVAQANRDNDLKVTRMRQNIRDAKERRRTQV